MHLNIIFAICAACYQLSNGERLHEQIYSSIQGGAACFRRLNGTHQVGCSSGNNGAVGVVHLVKEVNDAIWVINNASTGPYMAIVSTALIHDVINIFLEKPGNVAGILLYHNSSLGATAFSQDSKCPNEYASGPGSTCSSMSSSMWNEHGTDLMRRNIPFPMFFLPESRLEEIKKIEDCFERFNLDINNQRGNPLCSVQMSSFMYAAVDSIVCMRRSAGSALITPAKVCDPLGDLNVYYSQFPQSKKEAKKPVVMVTARIDSASLFDGISPGAASSTVGMVTLIAAATILRQMMPADVNPYDKNVLWTLFNGEAFDYIGSQKVAYDMMFGEWPPVAPLKLSDIDLYLEIGQIGGSLLAHQDIDDWPLHMFAPTIGNNLDEVAEIVNDLSANLKQFNMSLQLTSSQNLPPSSLHSFRRAIYTTREVRFGKNQSSVDNSVNKEMLQMVMVDHNERFTNMFYNSALDDYSNINFNYHNISIGNDGIFVSTHDLIANGTMKRTETQVKIALLATAVARTLYKKIVGESYTGNLTASAHLVDEMLYCFQTSQACRLLLAADYAKSSDEDLPEKPAPLYVGVVVHPGTAAVFVGHLLALLTGSHLTANQTQCEAMDKVEYSYYWLQGWNNSGVCIQTTMNFSQAISPAFTISNYDFTSGEFSTWTESVWLELWVRVFVSAGGGGAKAAAAAGVVVTILAAFLTYWLQSRARSIFINSPTATGSLVSGDAAAGILRTVNC